MEPLISVIIPVYQVEHYVAHCIESVINQTYRNLEIILIDDGSTDESGEICDIYADRDERIRVVHQENAGLSAARNRGIEIAQGEYLSFVDSDDWIDRRFIEILYKISAEAGCDIVQCCFWNVFSDDREETEREGNYTVYSPKTFSISAYTLLSWKCNVAWNKLYKKSLFEGIRYPKGKIHEDEFTTYKLIWNANNIAVTNTKLYFYRQRTDSIMGSVYSLRRLDAGDAYKEREDFYEKNGETTLLNLVRMAHLEWLKWNLPLVRECNGAAGERVAVLEKEKAYLEKKIEDTQLYKRGLKFHGYLFPFSQIPYGSRVILYGAGDVGTQYYRQITELNYCDVVAWVDGNAEKYKHMGFPVKGKEEIQLQNIGAEYIVIAVNNDAFARDMMRKLRQEGNAKQIIYEIIKI